MSKNCPECGRFLYKVINDENYKYEWYCTKEECYHEEHPVEFDSDDYWGDFDDELRKFTSNDPRLTKNQALQSPLLKENLK